jgi:hypothetical protein
VGRGPRRLRSTDCLGIFRVGTTLSEVHAPGGALTTYRRLEKKHRISTSRRLPFAYFSIWDKSPDVGSLELASPPSSAGATERWPYFLVPPERAPPTGPIRELETSKGDENGWSGSSEPRLSRRDAALRGGMGKVEVVNVEGGAVGRATFEPGWQWSSTSSPSPKPTAAKQPTWATSSLDG